jgi:hypothetical protein
MDMNGDHGPRVIRRSPVTLTVLPTVADARRFPTGVVEGLRPRAGRVGWGVLLGLAAALALAVLLGEWPVAERAETLVRGAAFVAVLVLLALNYARGHPVGNAIGGVAGAAVALAGGAPVGPSVVALLVVGGLTVPAWLGHRARRRWWPRLEALLADHRLADGVAHSVERVAASGRPYRYVIQVSSPDLPGFVWAVEEQSSSQLQPRTGDRVAVWYRPADPEAAVLCVALDEVSQAARAQRTAQP